MEPVKPPRTKYPVKSPTTGSYDLPSTSAESKPGHTGKSQPVTKVRPKPMPRSKSQPESFGSSLSFVVSTENSSHGMHAQNGYPADYKTPCAVRPPPNPPRRMPEISISPSTADTGSPDHLTTTTGLTVQTSDVCYERPPTPVPPPRPGHPPSSIYHPSSEYERRLPEMGLKPATSDVCYERPPSPVPPPHPEHPPSSIYHPSSEYERRLPEMWLKPASSTAGSPSTQSPSPLPARRSPVPPPLPPLPPKAEKLNLSETYCDRTSGVTVTDTDTDRPAHPPRPPRPGLPPAHTLSRSPSGHETSPPQQVPEQIIQETAGYLAVYEDRRAPPPIPPKTRNHSAPGSGSTALPISYDMPTLLRARGNSAPEQPQKPPPPSFSPPPPPVVRRQTPSAVYQTEALYDEIQDHSYLEVLPDETGNSVFSPSYNVYNSDYKHYKTPGRPTLAHTQPSFGPRYQNTGFPPLETKTDDTEDINHLLRWLKAVGYSDSMGPSVYGLSVQDETREFTQRAMCVKKALRLFNLLLIKRNDNLRSHISELTAIIDSLEKVQKKTKTMGIAGGTTGAVGGVAAVVGIALAPMTMGISLVATAIGAGMLASAGGMGAHAAIINKKKVDKMLVERIVQDYKADIVDVECCLMFIHSGMDELRRHDLPRLQRAGAHPEALRMAELSQSVFRNDMCGAMGKFAAHSGGMSSERLLQAFAKEMDLYFTDKDGHKLKKGTEMKFSSRVRVLAESLQEALDELNHMWDTFSRY